MQAFFAKHGIKAQKIAVGVSGGADSLALVLQLKEQLSVFGYEIVALTVNHNLRPNSAQEAEYVAQLMQKYGIEHHILPWTAADKDCGCLEEKARKARYELMRQWCTANAVKVLAVAHHLRDQAETFLLRLERGSGLTGLCAMREVTRLDNIMLVRPFLHTAPEELRQYLLKRKIAWVEDESNADLHYLRNRIRHFLPQLTAQTDISLERIVSAADNLQSAEDYIEKQLEELLQNQITHDFAQVYSFAYADFVRWHPEMQFRVLARLCRRQYIPRAERVKHLCKSLLCLPFKGATLGEKKIILAYRRVWIVPEIKTKHEESREAWKKFIIRNPQYENYKIPHAVRVVILSEAKNDI